jgi:hypothetical protein
MRRIAVALLISPIACTDPPPRETTDATAITVTDAFDAFDAVAHDAAPACSRTTLDWGQAGDRMLPGSDCIACHRESGSASAHVFTVAGTVFTAIDCPAGLSGATVHIEDSAGHVLDLPTNDVGNFYSNAPLVPPLRAHVSSGMFTAAMNAPVSTGSCNSCHAHGDAGIGWLTPFVTM